MFTLNTLTDKVRQVLGGVQQQAPRALNEIGNFINKPITAQRGSSTPNFQQPMKLAQSVMKPIAQQPLAQSIPGMQGGSRLMSMSMPQVKQPNVGDAGRLVYNLGKQMVESTIYNPQTKQIAPQNLYTRIAQVPKPKTIQDLKNPNSPYREGMLDVDINTVIGAMTGGTGSKNPIKPYRIDIMPDDLAVAKNFAATVERLGTKGNKANLGQLGIDASRVVERYFGRKFALLPNTKIKQLFDYMLAKADNSRAGGQPGGIVVKPKGVTLPVGLSAQETEGLAQNAFKKEATNFTPLDVPALKQKQAAQKLPKIMFESREDRLLKNKIIDVKPKTTLYKNIEVLKQKVQQQLSEQKVNKEMGLEKINKLTSSDLRDISSLRKMANSKIGQEGDIETLYKKDSKLVGRVLDKMREISNDYETGANKTDEELLDMALTLPKKSELTVKMPPDVKTIKILEEQAKNTRDMVYNAEPKLKVVDPKLKAEQEFKEWSRMVYKDTVSNEKKTIEQGVKSVKNIIEESTQEGLKKKYVSGKKGNIITNKAGDALDKDIMDRAEVWKDKPKLLYGRETMERNFDDIMGADAPEMKTRFIDPIKKSEADRMRWLNKERAEISSYGIKPRSKESSLVQLFGEGKVPRNELVTSVGEKRANQLIDAAQKMRNKYDQYLDDINIVLKRNGYDPIPKRKDYFTHFQEVTNVLEQFGVPVRDMSLPTDVNGLTAGFKPGKNFFSSALPRLTDKTDMDAVTGLDRYIEGASKQMFHTDNIQNLRLLEKSIRAKFAGTKHLTNFVADLTDYTNTLAGKKAEVDRSVEATMGRGIYAASNRLRQQVGANMVGANISSAVTNFIPLTQSMATTSKPSFVKGMLQTMSNVFKNDGFVNRSDFLTRRYGSDPLSMRLWDKAANKAGWLFKTVDHFVANTIVRSKFDEGISKGMSPEKAMKYADDWAAKIMADRSLGSMPTLFNSKTLGAITQFQLEVNNQLSFMAKDIPRSYNKIGAASALGQVFLYSYLFNNLYEKLTGRRPAFDPIGVAQRTIEDYSNPNMKQGQATKNMVRNISDQLPFTSSFTGGGRLPINAAIPDFTGIATGEKKIGEELKKPLFYVLPPFGGGQLKKTIEGWGAYNKGYSESSSGRVRYPIPQTAGNLVKTPLFGQYSTPEATKYFREGTSVLGEKQSETLKNSMDKKQVYQDIINEREQNKKTAQDSTYATTKLGDLLITTKEQDNMPFPDYSKSAPGQTLRADLKFEGKGNADIVFHMRTPEGKVIDVPQTKETYVGGSTNYGLELKVPNGTQAGTGEVWVTVNGQEVAGTRKKHEIINTQPIDRYSDVVRKTNSNDPTFTRDLSIKEIMKREKLLKTTINGETAIERYKAQIALDKLGSKESEAPTIDIQKQYTTVLNDIKKVSSDQTIKESQKNLILEELYSNKIKLEKQGATKKITLKGIKIPKGKKPKKITIAKLKAPKLKTIRTIKIKIPKLPKLKKTRLTFKKKKRTIRVKV